MTKPCNIAAALPGIAAERPDAVAIRCPGGTRTDGRVEYDVALSYRELDYRSDRIAAALARIGIVRGTRTALMVRPSPELFLLMFALFKAGAVPVLIDPGISRRALKQCLDEAAPEAFIGIPLAQAARVLLGWARRSVRIVVTVGRRWFWGGYTLDRVLTQHADAPFALAATQPDEVAAILFTSGSTGVPKGVTYRHRHFVAQVEMLREAFGIEPGGVDLPTFPPFALFDPALGLTSVIPDMDPTRPAQADPRKLIDAIERYGVSQMFGSPALLDTLSRYGERHGTRLPSLRRVLSAGAPVPPAVVARMQAMLPDDAQIWTPYGATECLPVAIIEGRELRATREATEAGAGTCVGRPVARNCVRIIHIDDAPLPAWHEALVAAPGAVGEITVAGPSATDEYFRRPAASALAKIPERLPDGTQRVVHRMGDLGYFDAEGRLWFCGRKTQRVETPDGALYTEQVEPVFNTHAEVKRTALVGVGARGAQRAVLCVELERGVPDSARERIEAELLNLGARLPHTARIQTVRFHPGFPVDIRHNAKIGREQLARWATGRLGERSA
ncbi:MAG: fatty acid CoA ligase family protein [Chiayiivirga sp.]|jgi:acyl-CoA synthetase (AMP-forming)/AMP-acid ligase II|uniref:olefin beta-lactone synthetase n=1 Tax=Chiayiivirga sp. TaxID=2041042 RepID=UPI0025BA9D73|nr:fatty acid CoA ligase family protein [Chiayiivirga sp.]MCI1711251.1 fatty acid CoA ligase family protein [Chiayiivirga sp.]MCI1727945.1 fatty acid CoA ligase family protein [Chiayiivirga sp.]